MMMIMIMIPITKIVSLNPTRTKKPQNKVKSKAKSIVKNKMEKTTRKRIAPKALIPNPMMRKKIKILRNRRLNSVPLVN
jgi:hypothetical protein